MHILYERLLYVNSTISQLKDVKQHALSPILVPILIQHNKQKRTEYS